MILLFSGAGSSKAVDPQQYPTTIEFFKRLPDVVTTDDLFKRAVEYLETVELKNSEKAGPIDIEQILWLISDLREFVEKANNRSSVPGWFLDGNRLSSAVGVREDLNAILNVSNLAKRKIEQLASNINRCVYDWYGEPPTEEKLRDNWIPLLEGLALYKHSIEIVTTNYDIVIEEALSFAETPVITGRTKSTQPILDRAYWEFKALAATSDQSEGRLTKLHGSVDWIRGGNRIHVGIPLFQGQHDRHAIIYPGFKGEPTDPLFQVLHQYFQAKISEADIIIFIGYAFRDDYINRLLSTQVRGDTLILIINPEERLPTNPFPPNRFTQLRRGFDMQAVDEALDFCARFLRLGESNG